MNIHTYCRLCEGSCGLVAHVQDGAITALQPDADDPVSGGFLCGSAAASPRLLADPRRFTRPMRRTEAGLVPATWEEAIRDIGDRLRAARKASGPRGVGLFLGDGLDRNTQGFVRSLAFALGMGTPNVFSTFAWGAGPRVRMSELMLGHPALLLPDLGRAHFVVMFGGEPDQTDWGASVPGMTHERDLRHSRKTKGTKVVVVDPRKTKLAGEMDQHLACRPGTEPFLLLGMLSSIVKGNLRDVQFVDDYTTGYDRLVELISAWPLERCAEICGVDVAALSGVTLKFARAAMATAWLGPSALANSNASVGAWAWLALHTITANTLRPGGLYDHRGVFDLHIPLALIPTAEAPRTRVGGQLPLILLQAPGSLFADEALQGGEGQLKALISVSGNPARALPASQRVASALDGLDTLVCLSAFPDETTEKAHWVLPITLPWERADLHLLDTNLLPHHLTGWTPALLPAAGEARPEAQILKELFAAVHPGVRGSSFGPQLALGGRYLATADLDAWQARLTEWFGDAPWSALEASPHRIDRGDADRATWRVTTPDGKINLVPDEIVPLLEALREPAHDEARPLRLRTTRRPGRAVDRLLGGAAPVLSLHPSSGVAEGSRVKISTRAGSLVVPVKLDLALRPDTADLPHGWGTDALALVGTDRLDPLLGTPDLDGLACRIDPA